MILRYDPAEIIDRTTGDVHPPLYYLVLDWWAAVFGQGLVALRAFSLVCMVASGLVIVRINQVVGLVHGRWQSALVMLGVGFGSMTVIYAQEARMYGFGSLLVALCTLALIRLHHEPSKGRAVIYGGSVAACAYTHYFSLGFVLVHVVWFLGSGKGALADRVRRARWLAGGLAVGAVLFVPWLPRLAQQFERVDGDFWVASVTWRTPIETLYQMFSGETLLLGASASLLVLILLVPTFVVLFGLVLASPSQRHGLLLLVLPLPITVLALYALSLDALGFSSVLIPRYLAMLAPLAYGGIAAAALIAFDRASPVHWTPAIAAALILGYGADRSMDGISRAFRTELAPVAAYVSDRAGDDDLILVDRYYHFYGLFHHLGRDSRVRVLVEPDNYGGLSLLRDRTDILLADRDLVDVDARVWLIQDERVLPQHRARTEVAFERWNINSRRTIDQLEVVELERRGVERDR